MYTQRRQRGNATLTYDEAEKKKNRKEDIIYSVISVFYIILVSVMLTSYAVVVTRRSCDCVGKGCFPEIEERMISQLNVDFQNCSTTVKMTTTDVELEKGAQSAAWLNEYIMDSLIVDKLEIIC
ncbi:unnamed protein product [Oikopleura dioica]|uniref:Uncharacterized protein n=1 Tax=Oikopleura dioica TaxID=34765 RepID=E4Y953_OIKDI|nr:unnamed protein product [Oikopleura dioica]